MTGAVELPAGLASFEWPVRMTSLGSRDGAGFTSICARGSQLPSYIPRALAQQSLKVVVFNVLRGELQRLTGDDLSGGIDLILTRPLSFLDRKRVAGLSLNLSLG